MKRANAWQKIADRFIGIPLLIGFSFLTSFSRFFKRRTLPRVPESMGIFCVAALGDLLLLSQSIRTFRQKYPKCRLTLFCGPDNKSLLPLIDPDQTLFAEIHVLKPKALLENFVLLRKISCDVVIDSGQWARMSALLSSAVHSNWRVGFQTKGQLRHFLFDQKVQHQPSVHEIENFHHLFSNWIEVAPTGPKLVAGDWKPAFKNYVVCHLFPSGAQSEQKEWPKESWLELFNQLQQIGYQIVLTGAPGDRTRLLELFSTPELRNFVDLVGKTSLEQSRDLLAKAQFVVSVNTGIMHLAASLDVPLIALHGPTNPKRWGPVSAQAHVVQSQLACSPCLNLGFEYGCPRNDCMKNITPEQVLQKVKEKILPLS